MVSRMIQGHRKKLPGPLLVPDVSVAVHAVLSRGEMLSYQLHENRIHAGSIRSSGAVERRLV